MLLHIPVMLTALYVALINGAALPEIEEYEVFANATAEMLEVRSSGWAQFCSSRDCTNCGRSVALDNPGCLGETGRGSIKFHGNTYGVEYALLFTPKGGCYCQRQCIDGLNGNSGCLNLQGDVSAESFRFIQGNCPENNC